MLGLGNYESSSEDEVEIKPSTTTHLNTEIPVTPQVNQSKAQASPEKAQGQSPLTIPASQVPSGPMLGPASVDRAPSDGPSTSGHISPFLTARALVQDLTLPPVPNLDIPPSPPGSPDPAANAKFEHFLALKKQGIHFNAKLASSSSLRNPSLLTKMMNHAGIDEQIQHNTSLPAELWNTSNLPSWAFKEELLRSQQEARQRRENKKASGQRSTIEFVSDSSSAKPGGATSGLETRKKANP